jgi:hypothetical protein
VQGKGEEDYSVLVEDLWLFSAIWVEEQLAF